MMDKQAKRIKRWEQAAKQAEEAGMVHLAQAARDIAAHIAKGGK